MEFWPDLFTILSCCIIRYTVLSLKLMLFVGEAASNVDVVEVKHSHQSI